MSADIDELTVNYEDDGQLLCKELDKRVLTRGAWATVLYKYCDWDRKKEDYGPVRYTIRRYRKINNAYRQQSKFNISSKDQARKIIDILSSWVDDDDTAHG